VLALNLGLSLAVGVRLLRLSFSRRGSIERWLALYFLLGVFAGGALVTAAYAGWSDPSLGMPGPWIPGLHAAGTLCIGLGTVSIFVFTWRTFRPAAGWAAAATAGGTAALAVGFVGRCLAEGFGISTDPGFFHWLMYWVRIVSLVWVASEAVAYSVPMGRRLRLGLVEPLVADRFRLWSVWASASLLTALSEVIARAVFHWLSGDSPGVGDAAPGLAAPIIVISLTITSVTGLISAGTLFLTFFPTDAYRRWVERRAATATT
jgi:hypothetical protein